MTDLSKIEDRRLKTCVEAWPECREGEYDPSCCRFPKSCSCTIYTDGISEDLLEPSVLECCGQPVDDDGYCQHRSHHRRQITPELLDKAVDAAARHADPRSQVRAVLEAVL